MRGRVEMTPGLFNKVLASLGELPRGIAQAVLGALSRSKRSVHSEMEALNNCTTLRLEA